MRGIGLRKFRWPGVVRPFIAQWILAPSLYRFLKGLLIGRERSVLRLRPDSFFLESAKESGLSRLRFSHQKDFHWVSLARCVNEAGASFTIEQNNFVRYFQEGTDGLRRFYRAHLPRDAFEILFDQAPRDYRGKGDFHWRMPWNHFQMPSNGAKPDNIQVPDRNQWWGPVSERRLTLEGRRLSKLQESIQANGYRCRHDELQDFPHFQLLVDDSYLNQEQYRLLIVQGVHRVSVLAYLDWEHIPVVPSPLAPREIRLSDVERWPGVVDGTFSISAATRFFRLYFRPEHTQLIKDW